MLADGVTLGGLDQMRFGIEFYEVGDVRIVSGILSDEPALSGEHTDGTVGMGHGSNLEQMTGVVGRAWNFIATVVEVVVEVFDFLVAGKEVHVTCPCRSGMHVVKVGLDQLIRNIGGNVDVTHENHHAVY